MTQSHHVNNNVRRSIFRFTQALTHAVDLELTRPRGYGCVTIHNTGAHTDMTEQTFRRSTASICRSLETFDWESIDNFHALRIVGQQAETRMFQCTNGINTQKGLLFLALFLAKAWTAGIPWSDTSAYLRSFAQPLYADYQSPSRNKAPLRKKQGLSDIRMIPLSGYENLFRIVRRLEDNPVTDDCLTLYLISICDDTTTVERSNVSTLRQLQDRARTILKDYTVESAKQLDHFYRTNNISSGGVADLFSTIQLLRELRKDWI